MNSLVPVEEREVHFYDDVIYAVRLEDGRVFIPLRPIIERLGLDWSAQTRRINRDMILGEEKRNILIATSTGQQEMLCLPLDFISGFLFGINPKRVDDDLRDNILRYQRECYKVLAEAFQEGRLTQDSSFDELLLDNDSETVQAYKMLRAMVKLARNQVVLEAQLGEHALQLGTHATQLGDLKGRLEELESTIWEEKHNITPDQASQISQAVKLVAVSLGKKTGKNEFGSVYGEFYRQFGITSYKLLPTSKFETAMRFLTNWHQELVGDTPF
ncbi:MAG: ORF6C domain-containing protein [Anaerolineales bacterium]|nr:ORF6C domain-containing protein [Anaerolineales bacterium]